MVVSRAQPHPQSTTVTDGYRPGRKEACVPAGPVCVSLRAGFGYLVLELRTYSGMNPCWSLRPPYKGLMAPDLFYPEEHPLALPHGKLYKLGVGGRSGFWRPQVGHLGMKKA